MIKFYKTYLFLHILLLVIVFAPQALASYEELAQNSENHSDDLKGNIEYLDLNLDQDQNLIENKISDINFENSENLRMSLKTVFQIKLFSDRSRSDLLLSTQFYGKLYWQVLDSISFYNQIIFVGKNGFTQSIYDQGDFNNGLHLIESYFDIDIGSLKWKFGNIKQDFLQAPLLLTDKTFPSIIHIFTSDSDTFTLKLLAQQAVMNNSVESIKREGGLIEGYPLLFTNSLFLNKKAGYFNLEDKFTIFYMHNLSPALADRSRILGNSINFYKSDSRFVYKFFGIYNKFKIQKILSKNIIMHVGGDVIYNFLAKDTYSQGERIYSSMYYNYRDFIEWKLQGEYFANQSDTSVAYFNSPLYGHNNRFGMLLALSSYFYTSGLTLRMFYVVSKPINAGHKSSMGFASTLVFSLMSNYISML